MAKTVRKKGESLDDCIGRRVSHNVDKGKPQEQAIAIAHRECGAPPPKKKKDNPSHIKKERSKHR